MNGTPARILVVDDSVVVRRVLSELIGSTPGFEVAGTAATAAIALQKLEQVSCDLVLLDVEMPGMDGIEAVGRIRERWTKLPVVMCSGLTARGAEATLRALAAGATDYVAKPSTLAGDGQSEFARELIGKLRALTSARVVATPPPPVAPVPLLTAGRRVPPRRPAVVAIGCSTGGPNALARVFADIPGDLGVPILITQHMPPLFTRMLAERLSAISPIRVKEAEAGDVLEPGCGYVAPGDYHMTLRRDGVRTRIVLDQNPPENSCRPAVDPMFRSIAATFGRDVIAAVLTGMGRDGGLGARAIAEAGGWVITQEPSSCVVASMPNAVVELGASHETADLAGLGTLLSFHCRAAAAERRLADLGWKPPGEAHERVGRG